MDKKVVYEIIEQSSKSLMLNLNEQEINDFFNRFDTVLENMEAIKNFDLSNYESFAFLDDPQTQTRLREDEPIFVENHEEYFKNAVEFDGEMVVVKNEK